MTIRSLVRRLSLLAPPIRRLYDRAITETARADQAHAVIEDLTRRLDAAVNLAAPLDETRRLNEQLMTELATVTQEREDRDLQLYVLRSDFQRATGRNDQLLERIRDLEAEVAAAYRQAEQLSRQAEQLSHQAEQLNCELTIARQPQITLRDFELLNAKLAAQITLLSQDVASQVKRALPAAGARNDVALYLDLMEKVLTGEINEDPAISPWSDGYDPNVRMLGRDWPKTALTMIGGARLSNLRLLAERVIDENIPGDFLEAGVWRGGACVLLRAILAAHNINDRRVWVADSFAGLPPPDPDAYPADQGDQHHTVAELAVSMEDVAAGFTRFGLLDDQVRFLKGWFADTLPGAPIETLAILRLDGDMYSSTIQTLDALYAKVSVGGFVIVDDYILSACRQAVTDFRERHGVTDPIQDIDGAGVYWRKGSSADAPHG